MFIDPANVLNTTLGLLMTLVIITVSRSLAPEIKENPDVFSTCEWCVLPVGSAWHTYLYERSCSTVVIVKGYCFLGTVLLSLSPSGKKLKNMKLTGVRSLAIIPIGLLDFCKIRRLG